MEFLFGGCLVLAILFGPWIGFAILRRRLHDQQARTEEHFSNLTQRIFVLESELREHARIDTIGLGAAAGAAGKVADLAGVDDGEGELGGMERLDDGKFPAAGGFANDVAGPFEFLKIGKEGRTTGGIVGEAFVHTLLVQVEV